MLVYVIAKKDYVKYHHQGDGDCAVKVNGYPSKGQVFCCIPFASFMQHICMGITGFIRLYDRVFLCGMATSN